MLTGNNFWPDIKLTSLFFRPFVSWPAPLASVTPLAVMLFLLSPTNVTSKEDALRLISDGNVDNFTLAPDLANASSITGVTVDEAGALLRNELGATNGLLDASVISIKDTVTNLNNAVDQFYNELSNVANIHATVSNIADAVSFVSGSLRSGASFSDDRLSQLVDEFSLDLFGSCSDWIGLD